MLRMVSFMFFLFTLFPSCRAGEADSLQAQADTLREDSVATVPPTLSIAPLERQENRVRKSKWREFSYVPVPLIVSSFIVKTRKDDFRGARNNFIPHFHYELDNYIQYSPFALTLALKAAGVEGRNQWGRMLVSSALSYAAMAALVNGAKYTIKEERPDGSSRNSFPSGHTATVFASATILHKEYGLTRSLWYSAAGYAIATATGVMRVMNNRHWASDILAGAGIGIFSVDLGYFLSDIMFKDKYTLRQNQKETNNFLTSPSFFNLNIGFGLLKHHMDIGDKRIEGSKSIQAQAELAYFMTPNVGAGLRLGIAAPTVSFENYNDNMGLYSLDAGAYVQIPLTPRFAIGGKLLAGRMAMSGFSFENVLSVEKSFCFTYGMGFSASYAYRNNIAWRLNADYDGCNMPVHATYKERRFSTHKPMHQITLSGSMSVMF